MKFIPHRNGLYAHLKDRLQHYANDRLRYRWEHHARPEQRLPEGDWRIWLILAGRGFGKTRTGAEAIRHLVRHQGYKRICLLGNSIEEVRTVMVQGISGLLSVSAPEDGISYNPSQRCISWSNGAKAFTYSAQSYEQLRGPQFDLAWIDELAKFSHAQQAWDQLMMGLRLGQNPRVIITTTPRSIDLIHQLLERSDVHITRGTTFDNRDNLSVAYLKEMEITYGNTRLGAQELEGKVIPMDEGGLWHKGMIKYGKAPSDFKRIVVAIDPAVSCTKRSDETGIIVVGCDHLGQGYVLADMSGKMTPTQWIERAIYAYHHYHADRIIAEINNGGDVVMHLLHTLFPHIPYRGVRATRGKIVRAEPIAALYEQGKITHCDYFSALEHQMIAPFSGQSPDRLDALVWGLSELFLGKMGKKDPSITLL